MPVPPAPNQPGLLAVSWRPGRTPPDLSVLTDIAASTTVGSQRLRVTCWGLGGDLETALAELGRLSWGRGRPLTADQLTAFLGGDQTIALPPAAVVAVRDDRLVAAVDHMGFRQLYWTETSDWAAVSTSALLLHRLTGRGLDSRGLSVQSLLGWQLAQQTLFTGVCSLGPGHRLELREGILTLSTPDQTDAGPGDAGLGGGSGGLTADLAVERAVAILREQLEGWLDVHPETLIQLTGGQDSRLLLSAVPRQRRHRLRAMTLGLPGDPDVAIAHDLADRYGMSHAVHWFDGMDGLSPEQAFELCQDAALRLDCCSDPIAFAALGWAEAQFEQGPRLSGLGGEVARGFYYLGGADLPVTQKAVRRLTSWRMFANESIDPDAVTDDFAATARTTAERQVSHILTRDGLSMARASDALYLRHRMQRWAGVTETAVAFDRCVASPMLDFRFIELANALPPAAKSRSRFLAQLQVALDPELAAIPLEGRPSPATYARAGLGMRVRLGLSAGKKAERKLAQRLRGQGRPPAGGQVLTSLLSTYFRDNPAALSPVRSLGIFREPWLDGVVSGSREPSPSTMAFLVNLTVAAGART